MSPLESLTARFWHKVAICAHGRTCPHCCWPWQGGTARGYGEIFVPKALRPSRSPIVRAHRVCWFLTYGVWPTFHVLHTCDNPPCLQPAHLWQGNDHTNHLDMVAKGRSTRGSTNPQAKLNRALILEIYRLVAAGHGDTAISRMLDVKVGRQAIAKVRLGQRWAHIKEESHV